MLVGGVRTLHYFGTMDGINCNLFLLIEQSIDATAGERGGDLRNMINAEPRLSCYTTSICAPHLSARELNDDG